MPAALNDAKAEASSAEDGVIKESKTRCPVAPDVSWITSAAWTVFTVKVAFVDEIVSSVPSGFVKTNLSLAKSTGEFRLILGEF